MRNVRSVNKQKRRDRILDEARNLIARKGFDALSLRELAACADVSVPTIYNLIGCKEQLLKALVLGAFADFEKLMQQKPPVAVVKLPAKMLDTLIEMISADPDYYRATFLASERIEGQQGAPGGTGFRRVALRRLAANLIEQAQQQALLRGEIAPRALVETLLASHDAAYCGWAHRLLSLEEFRAGSLRGFYIALAADAVDSFRQALVAELNGLPHV
jgi:AcrR family transcriptional regulator